MFLFKPEDVHTHAMTLHRLVIYCMHAYLQHNRFAKQTVRMFGSKLTNKLTLINSDTMIILQMCLLWVSGPLAVYFVDAILLRRRPYRQLDQGDTRISGILLYPPRHAYPS